MDLSVSQKMVLSAGCFTQVVSRAIFMQNQPSVPKFFQDIAPQLSRLGLWQKKLSAVAGRLRLSTVQKISASDEGYLILNLYKPAAPRDPAIISIRRTGSGIELGSARPQTQPKPNSLVQLARKYLQGRRISQVLLSLEPVTVVIEFSPLPEETSTEKAPPSDAPDCLIVDLDSRPARVCVARRHSYVPERYADQCTGFEGDICFFESHCEWTIDNTKTKRRATFNRPLVLSCFSDAPDATSTSTSTSAAAVSIAVASPQTESNSAGADSVLQAAKDSPAGHEKTTLQSALNFMPTHVRRAARTRLQFLERRLQRQKADLPPVSELERLKHRAEGLRAHIYMWPKDFPQWHVPPDIIESAGLPAVLTLKAGQSAGDLVTQAFNELDKLNRRRSELEKRVEESKIALERFEDVIRQAGDDILALSEDVLASQISLTREVRHLVSVQRLLTQLEVTWLPSAERAAAAEAEKERRLPYRSFRASSGEFIRVSKSAADADAMLKLMPAHHTWVHVITGEGSHVWLEKPKGAKPSDSALREAAILAIHYSKQTRAQEADVYVALRADLDKKKDLSAGKVIVRRSEHRFVRYEQAELQSLLEASGN